MRKNRIQNTEGRIRKILYSSFCILYSLATSLSLAQLSYKGEIEVANDLSLASTNQALTETFGLTFRGHLELDYALDPIDFRLVLDPTVRLAGSDADNVLFEPGLTEAFALYRLDSVDLSAGLERLPLETARLSVPFRVEPVNATGQALGLLGARASLFLDDWRVRPALVYRTQDEQLGGVVSVRREFSRFDLEAHVLYLDGFATGLGGSGLIGDIVLYGEAWLLTDPWDGRGALGLSGYWGDLLYTAEVAYAADPLDSDLNLDDGALGEVANPYPQLLGQFSLPQGDAGTVELNASVGVKDSVLGNSNTLQVIGNLRYTHTETDYQLTVGPTFSHTELAIMYGVRLGVTGFF